jgi:hypothetical protein
MLVPKIVDGRKDLGQPLWTFDFGLRASPALS